MPLKHTLRQIEPDCDNLRHDRSPLWIVADPLWHTDAVGGAFSGISNAIGGVGQTVAQTAAPALENINPLDESEAQVRATGNDPEALNNAAVTLLAIRRGDVMRLQAVQLPVIGGCALEAGHAAMRPHARGS